jgi:hypothetical protein
MKSILHAREAVPFADGSYLAVTLMNRPPHGIMAWAGALSPGAADKQGAEIEVGDYKHVEKVSFCQWADVWDYFEGRQYDALLARLRAETERGCPGE